MPSPAMVLEQLGGLAAPVISRVAARSLPLEVDKSDASSSRRGTHTLKSLQRVESCWERAEVSRGNASAALELRPRRVRL